MTIKATYPVIVNSPEIKSLQLAVLRASMQVEVEAQVAVGTVATTVILNGERELEAFVALQQSSFEPSSVKYEP